MSIKHDRDLKTMTPAQLRREVMRLRHGIRMFCQKKNNAKCHLNEPKLCALVGMHAGTICLTKKQFKRNCDRYIARQCRVGLVITT